MHSFKSKKSLIYLDVQTKVIFVSIHFCQCLKTYIKYKYVYIHMVAVGLEELKLYVFDFFWLIFFPLTVNLIVCCLE